MRLLSILLLTIFMVVFASCSNTTAEVPDDSDTTTPAEVQTVESQLNRNPTPMISREILDTLVQGNGKFALDLYHQLINNSDNLFFSPHSISTALAMTYAGARGDTETQMADTLHYDLPQEELHPALNWLDITLSNRSKNMSGEDGTPFKLNVANSVWGQQGYNFLPFYLDVLAVNYGAGLKTLDFSNAAASAKAINDWVSNETEGYIKDLITPDVITPLTRLILTNAIYFEAGWKTPFNLGSTSNAPFYLLNGDTVSVPTMTQAAHLGYAEGATWKVVEIPYVGDEISMVVILPDSGKFTEFSNSLDYETLQQIISSIQNVRVNLNLPRFTFDSNLDLKKVLMNLGMSVAFSNDADFSGMVKNDQLHIDDVRHKAFVAVDETGTKAAAATAVAVGTEAAEQVYTMNVDHPFIFLIRDIPTGEILFLGNVLDPSE